MSVVLNGSSQCLYTLNALTGATFTLSAWMKPTNVTSAGIVACSDIKNSTLYKVYGMLNAAGTVGGDPLCAQCYDGSTYKYAATTTGYVASTWQHVCGVFTSSSSRAAFLDGGSKGTNSESCVGNANEFVVGCQRSQDPLSYFNGKVAQVAIWDIALSDAEVAQLAEGVSPQNIQAAHLTNYWTLATDGTRTVGSYDLSSTGSPTFDEADNPNVNPEMHWRRILTEYMPSVTPTLNGLTANGLTASRLVATGAGKALASVTDLTAWIAGTTNRVTVSSDGDGTLTITAPQDLHTGATPQFARLGLGAAADATYKLHVAGVARVYAGASGQANAENGTNLIVESNSASVNYISFLSPNTAYSGIIFGDPEDADAGYCLYYHTDNSMQWRTNSAAVSLTLSSGGDLTNTGTIRANTGFNHNGTAGLTDSAAGTLVDAHVSGGLVTAVTRVTPAANGTYANPTSITISGGVITAIS